MLIFAYQAEIAVIQDGWHFEEVFSKGIPGKLLKIVRPLSLVFSESNFQIRNSILNQSNLLSYNIIARYSLPFYACLFEVSTKKNREMYV